MTERSKDSDQRKWGVPEERKEEGKRYWKKMYNLKTKLMIERIRFKRRSRMEEQKSTKEKKNSRIVQDNNSFKNLELLHLS